MKRLIVDASTLVSGVASRPGGGTPWLILEALLDHDFEAVACPRFIQEFRDGLGNSYFQKRVDPHGLAEIATDVERAAVEHENLTEIKPGAA